MKRKRKSKLPDFSKMSSPARVHWFDTHSMADYMDDMEDVTDEEAADEFKKTVLTLRVPVSLKKQLAREAGERGLRGASSYARSILEKHLEAA